MIVDKKGEGIVVERKSEETTCCDIGCLGSYTIVPYKL